MSFVSLFLCFFISLFLCFFVSLFLYFFSSFLLCFCLAFLLSCFLAFLLSCFLASLSPTRSFLIPNVHLPTPPDHYVSSVYAGLGVWPDIFGEGNLPEFGKDSLNIPAGRKKAGYKIWFNIPGADPVKGVTVDASVSHMHKLGTKEWVTVHRPKPGVVGGPKCASDCHKRYNGFCLKCFQGMCCNTRQKGACVSFGAADMNPFCCDQCAKCEGCEGCYPRDGGVGGCNPKGSVSRRL